MQYATVEPTAFVTFGFPGQYTAFRSKNADDRSSRFHHVYQSFKSAGCTARNLSIRRRCSGLLLLPKSFNASYGDLPYEKKRGHYLKQNLLAQILHDLAYENDPGFKRLLKESGLSFRPHSEFRKVDLDAWQALYQQLAETVWSPQNLLQELER